MTKSSCPPKERAAPSTISTDSGNFVENNQCFHQPRCQILNRDLWRPRRAAPLGRNHKAPRSADERAPLLQGERGFSTTGALPARENSTKTLRNSHTRFTVFPQSACGVQRAGLS